jgi:RNA polymerase sigma-70 factor (ECF subfamily)
VSGPATQIDHLDGSAEPHETGPDPDVDAFIIEGLRAGDDRAFELLVRTYVGPLRAVALRLLQNPADADDAVQEALLSAYRGFGNFRADSRLSTWLHRIVVNAALQRLRRARRVDETQDLDALLPRFQENGYPQDFHQPWAASIDDLVARAETRESVRQMIDRLPESYRTVLILRDIEEVDTAEAAELLGITPAALKVRLHRARQALRNLFERELELRAEA